MSSRQRKRPGGAVDSRPARKRSRLLPSSAAGTSQTEPIDLEQGAAPAFEPEVIDLTGESSEPEVIIISDDESAVEREQSQQQPHLFRGSEDSAEPLARDDEEEAREDDGDSILFEFDLPYWSDEDSEEREQNQQQSHLYRSAENSSGLLTTRDEEEPRDNDGARPAGPASTPARDSEDSEVQDKEQSQQYPFGSREEENSSELGASDNEEEPRDNDDSVDSSEWPDRFESPPTWQDDITDDWEGSQQYPLGSRSAENSSEVLESNLEEEPRDIEFYLAGVLVSPPDWEGDNAEDWEGSQQYPLGSRSAENSSEVLESNFEQEPRVIEFYLAGVLSPPDWEDDNAELLQVYGQGRRNIPLSRQEQVDGSGNGSGANDAPVADSAPAEEGPEQEGPQSSDAQQGVVIRCPICMDFYSEIMQDGRQLVATMCGHVFCSECLPIALETVPLCPTCREQLDPDLYIPLYI